MAPYFIVSHADPNGRQDARGRFLRIYEYNTPPSIQVTAQDHYGSLAFYRWTEYGAEIGHNPTIAIAPTTDRIIVANYVSLLPIPLKINRIGSQTTLSWQGGVGVRLQKRACLQEICAWQDVPGTEGSSSITISPPATGESYFRLFRVR